MDRWDAWRSIKVRRGLFPIFVVLLWSSLISGTLTSCGGDSSTDPAGSLTITPESGLAVGVGDRVPFRALVLDNAGRPAAGTPNVTWTSNNPGVATISSTGLATAVSMGEVTIQASAAGLGDATARLEVYVPQVDPVYEPGNTFSSRAGYAEYRPGRLAVIVSAPHGGDLLPDEIPDRTYGTTGTDLNTRDLAVAISDALADATGERPHLIVSNLQRVKLDPNREIVEAAQESPHAELAWTEYHGFIDSAKEAVSETHGTGLYLDIHGHGHAIQRVELGYLLSGSEMDQPDGVLDDSAYAAKSSIRALAASSSLGFSELLRGPASFGSLLQAEGYRAVPSNAEPGPAGADYFSGGYSTQRHGSSEGGDVSGIQLEHYRVGIRDTPENRRAYAEALAEVILSYMEIHHIAGAGAH